MTQTIVTFLLDRTGSMRSCKDATIEAFNAYLDTLRKNPEGIELSFLQFDSRSLDTICIAESPNKVAFLTDETYQPRASTPLIDAAYKTIKAVEAALARRDDTPKIVICIQTDGYENASTQYTMPELSLLVKEKTALGWQFVFMGAGIDAYMQGTQLGIATSHTMSYDQSRKHTVAAFQASAENAVRYAQGAAAGAAFSSKQRSDAADAFAPTAKPAENGNANLLPEKPAKRTMRAIVDDVSL